MFNNFFKDKKILVTGHTGFQGAWLSFWLNLLGASVIGFSLPPPTKPSLFEILELENNITHIIGNVQNLDELKSVISSNQPNFVFHLAAQPLVRDSYSKPLETFATNVLGTANILDCTKNFASIKGCIVYTSDKCYENTGTNKVYTESDCLGGNDPYSASKACAEIVANAYRTSFFNEKADTNTATIRAGNVIGGGDWAKDRLIPDFIRAIANHHQIEIRNPEHIRPWQFVLEPLSGILWLATKISQESKFSTAWNFGPPLTREQFTVKQLLKKFSLEWGIKENLLEYTDTNLHEDKFLNIDSSKAEKLLGLRSVYSLEKTITETVTWYKNFLNNKDEIKNFTIQQIENFITTAKKNNFVWIE